MDTFVISPRQSSASSMIDSLHDSYSALEDRLRADWPEDHPADAEQTFEEVVLDEDTLQVQHQAIVAPRRRGLFARFGDNGAAEKTITAISTEKNSSGFQLFSGRRKDLNTPVVADAELESMPRSELLFVAVEE
jgi:hypothetical protein